MSAIRLEYIQFYPTVRCNRSCSFCFNQSIEPVNDMDLNSYLKMLNKLKHHGVSYVDIMGGEPFLNRDIFEIVEYTIADGVGVNISTNGLLKEKVKEFFSRFEGKANLGISINSQADLKQSAELIRNYSPVTKSLYEKNSTNGLINKILSLGPRKHYIIYPDNLKESNNHYSIPFYEFYGIWKRVFASSGIEPVYCSGFLPDKKSNCLRCPAGTVKIGILPDGAVYPCNLFFGIKDFYLGNIFSDSIEKIISNPVLDFFRNYKGSPCKKEDCFLYNRCHGGCPVHSLIHYGSLSAPDPRCKNR